jgi:hypothetical protein
MTDSMVNEADPFGATVDEEDPFATEEEGRAGGGNFAPTPKIPDIHGRLVAMIPREFTKKALKAERFRKGDDDKYQDRYTVDLVVLDGGDLSFFAQVKEGDKTVEKEITVPAADLPQVWEGSWIFQQALIGQLRKVDGGARPILLGRVKRGPVAKDRGTKSFADVEQAWAAWDKRGRRGEEPAYSWQVDTAISEADRAVALRWWASVKDTIKLTRS